MCCDSKTITAKINPMIARTTISADTGKAENRSRRASATTPNTDAQPHPSNMNISMKKRLCPVSSCKNDGGLNIQHKSNSATTADPMASSAQIGRRLVWFAILCCLTSLSFELLFDSLPLRRQAPNGGIYPALRHAVDSPNPAPSPATTRRNGYRVPLWEWYGGTPMCIVQVTVNQRLAKPVWRRSFTLSAPILPHFLNNEKRRAAG